MEDSTRPTPVATTPQRPPFDPTTQPDQFLEWVVTPAGQAYLAGLNKALVEQRARSGETPDTAMVQVVQTPTPEQP